MLGGRARRLLADTGAERLAYLPVMTEGVDHAAHEPTVLFVHRPDFSCSGSQRLSVQGPGVLDDQDETSRCTAQGLRAEVLMRWRLVCYPELRALYCELRHHRAAILDLEQFVCAERRLVERHRIGATAHREHRSEADNGFVRSSWHA